MKFAIYIPTYKNRYSNFLKYCNTICDKFDIYICLSTYDDHINEYDNYNFDKRITILKNDGETIGSKNQQVFDYLYENGYTHVLLVEDDVLPIAHKITEETKRTTSNSYKKIKCDFIELINKMIDTCEKYDATFVSPLWPFSLGFQKPNKLNINKGINFGQCCIYNIKYLHDNNIRFNINKIVHQDIEIVINMLQHGLTCITIADYEFNLVPASINEENSILHNGTNTQDLMRLDLYKRYRDGINLRIGKHGELRMICRLNRFFNTFDLFIKGDDYHNKMYELCCNNDVEGVKDLIRGFKS